MQSRNTAEAVAFIRETKSNSPDNFWASGPEAFEALKKNLLLIDDQQTTAETDALLKSTPRSPAPVRLRRQFDLRQHGATLHTYF